MLPYFLNDLVFCYIKYLIDKKLHSYWNILFFIGLFRFLIYSIIFIIYIIKDPYNNYIFINIRKAKTKYIILNFFNEAILDVMQKLYPPLPGGMKFANPPYCKFHTPQGYKICKKNFNKLR